MPTCRAKVVGTGNHELTLQFPGGTQKVVVPSGIPLVRAVPGTRADLKPGEYIFTVGAGGGRWRASPRRGSRSARTACGRRSSQAEDVFGESTIPLSRRRPSRSSIHFAISLAMKRAELLRRAADRIEPAADQLLAHRGHRHHLIERLVETLHDIGRHARGADQALPRRSVEAGKSGLGDRRQIRGVGRALGRCDRERAQLAALARAASGSPGRRSPPARCRPADR